MKKFKLAFGIVSAAMLLCACGDDSVTNITDEAKDKGTITLKVVDYNTGNAIDSAEVFSLIDGKTAYTDSLGVTDWEKKVIGDYEYTVSKEGYATRTVTAKLAENSSGDIARVEDRITVVQMYRQGVSVKGTVLLKDPQSGNLSAASNASVVLSYTNDFIVPSEITTMTDASGVYEFENLAEGLTYSVKIPQLTVDGMTYSWASEKSVQEALRSGEQKVLDQVTMEVVGLQPELINDNLKTIEANDAIALSFSIPLLADSVSTSWKVFKSATGYSYDGENAHCGLNTTSVLTSANLFEDGKTVVITPISTQWTRLATYCIEGTVYTAEGKSVSFAKTFVPGSSVSRPGLVSNLSASDYYGKYMDLTWTAGEDEVKGYKAFYQTSETADFEEYRWDEGSLPTDSSKCAKVKGVQNCDLYEEYSSYDRMETNYYWYTDSAQVKVTSSDDYNVTDYTFTWTTSSEKDSVTCTVPYGSTYSIECETYIDLYGTYTTRTGSYDADDNYIYTYKWRFNKELSSPVTCTSSEYYYYNDLKCNSIYESIGTTPVRTTNYYLRTYMDSVSCTVKSTTFDMTPACVVLQEKYESNYRSVDYNYWWYTEYTTKKPTAESERAFIALNSVADVETAWIKVIVLPYVIVGGDTILADPVEATPAMYQVAK